MRAKLAYILIFCVLSNLFAKVFTMASFYYNQTYIAQNICINRFEAIPVCNGSCFLVSELRKNEPTEGNTSIPNSGPSTKIIESFIATFPVINFTSCFKIIKETKSFVNFYTCRISNERLFSIFHPPK